VNPAPVLTALTVLFFARVAGEAAVAFLGVPWLPPMGAWDSGLVPYPLLLAAQILILATQATIDWQVGRGAGRLASGGPRAGRRLRVFACVYAAAMLVRWLLTHTHGIPIVFHWVLAAYLFTLGSHYVRSDVSAGRRLPSIDR
jgi:hypothetical protein